MKKSKIAAFGLIVLACVAVVCVAVIALSGISSNWSSIEASNEQMVTELSNLRKQVYVATEDIAAGDQIVTSGSSANVQLKQVYSSFDSSMYFSDGDGLFAQRDISEGEPILKTDAGNEVTQKTITEETVEVVEEIEPEFEVSYQISARYRDAEGNSLSDSKTLQLSSGVTEQSFSSLAASVDGYELVSITIEGAEVYSFGTADIQTQSTVNSIDYYTDASGLSRVQILGDIEVIYTYEPAEEDVEEEEEYPDDGLLIVDEEAEAAEEEEAYEAITAESVQ